MDKYLLGRKENKSLQFPYTQYQDIPKDNFEQLRKKKSIKLVAVNMYIPRQKFKT